MRYLFDTNICIYIAKQKPPSVPQAHGGTPFPINAGDLSHTTLRRLRLRPTSHVMLVTRQVHNAAPWRRPLRTAVRLEEES